MNALNTILISFVIALIGALPLGLVNLSVLKRSINFGTKNAMQLAHGASVVELVYGFIAIILSSFAANYIQQSYLIKIGLIILVSFVALFFLLKTEKHKRKFILKVPAFFEGILLNLLSVQVFLFWIVALLYVNSIVELNNISSFVIPFLGGIWFAKMGVLWLYAHLGQRLLNKSKFITIYINKIIGIVLLFSVAIQLINF